MDEDKVKATIMELCLERGQGKTICPSEAARRVAGSAAFTAPTVRRVGVSRSPRKAGATGLRTATAQGGISSSSRR